MAHKQCPILFFSPLTSRGVWQYALITHRIGLSQIDLIKQIYYFFCGFRDFCEKLLFLSHTAQKILEIRLICVSQSPESAGSAISARNSSSSRRLRRRRRKVYGSHTD